MRDGARLFTSVCVPKTCPAGWPIMLNRTPYSVGPYGTDNYRESLGPSEHLQKDGFIFVYQDVRSRCMSEGTWIEVRPHNPAKASPKDTDQASDTADFGFYNAFLPRTGPPQPPGPRSGFDYGTPDG